MRSASVSMSRSWLLAALASAVASFPTPMVDIRPLLEDCQSTPAAQFVCRMQCPEGEPVLAEAFSPWWDTRFSDDLFNDMCSQVKSQWNLAYQATIRSGRLFYRKCSTDSEQSDDVKHLLEAVFALARVVGLPDVIFNFNVGDQPFTDKVYWTAVPQFHWVLARGHWTIPLPTPFHVQALLKGSLGDNPNIAQRHVPWERRTPTIFWRGSLSIPDRTPFPLVESTPRLRLMRIAREHPNLFDVGITGIDREIFSFFTKQQGAELMRKYKEVPALDFATEMPKFKYVINVAAVLSSWRLPELLASGALMFLQENSDMDLVHAQMTPWVHYVPIRNDLSDLVEKVEYMVANDDVAKGIANAGFAFFTANVTRASTLCYVWRAIQSMANNSDLTAQTPEDLVAQRSKGWKEVRQTKNAKRLEDLIKHNKAEL